MASDGVQFWIIAFIMGLASISLQGCGGADAATNETVTTLANKCSAQGVAAGVTNAVAKDTVDSACLCTGMMTEYKKKGEPDTSTISMSTYSNVLLRNWPMIHAHDSGTGYSGMNTVGNSKCGLNAVNNWAVTQAGGVTEQLNAGARAFDLRLTPQIGNAQMAADGLPALVYIHGDVIFHLTGFAETLAEIVAWAKTNKELVLLFVKASGDTGPAALEKLANAGITYDNDCTMLDTVTVGTAMSKSSAGSIWALSYKCGNQMAAHPSLKSEYSGGKLGGGNYDADVVCHTATTSCYDDNAYLDRQRLWDYVAKTMNPDPPYDKMWMVQAHWQYTGASIAAGVTEGSCILEDSAKTCVNLGMAAYIRNEALPQGLNLIDVDHVLHNGKELKLAVDEYIRTKLP